MPLLLLQIQHLGAETKNNPSQIHRRSKRNREKRAWPNPVSLIYLGVAEALQEEDEDIQHMTASGVTNRRPPWAAVHHRSTGPAHRSGRRSGGWLKEKSSILVRSLSSANYNFFPNGKFY
jgi:hypothetical protein